MSQEKFIELKDKTKHFVAISNIPYGKAKKIFPFFCLEEVNIYDFETLKTEKERVDKKKSKCSSMVRGMIMRAYDLCTKNNT